MAPVPWSKELHDPKKLKELFRSFSHWFSLISIDFIPFRSISYYFNLILLPCQTSTSTSGETLIHLAWSKVSLHLSGAWHTARLEPCMKCPQRRSHFPQPEIDQVSHQVIRVTPFVAHVAPFFSGIPIIPSYWEFGMRTAMRPLCQERQWQVTIAGPSVIGCHATSVGFLEKNAVRR